MTKNRQEAFGEVDKQEGAADEATQAQAQDTEAPQPEEDEEKDEAQMIRLRKLDAIHHGRCALVSLASVAEGQKELEPPRSYG